MGTTWKVLFTRPAGCDAAAVQTAINARLAALVAALSHWEPASDLSRFNRSPAGSWATLSPDLAAVIGPALRIAGESAGAFDPAIGRLVDLWGHGPPGPCPPPDDATLATAQAASGWRRLAWDAGARRLRQPGGVSLDLSGIAKGHAVDAVADLLRTIGIGHCLVEVGGELVGCGLRPDGEPWWVDLEDPPGLSVPPIRIALHGLAVATSGNYRRGDHSIDPRTGRPATNGVVSVSVIADTAMIADALATAILIAYPDHDALVGERAVRIVVRDRAGVREVLSPMLDRMMRE